MCSYKDIWDSHLDKELACRRESNNIHNHFAVAVLKSGVIVGHIPRVISAACYVFLEQAGSTIFHKPPKRKKLVFVWIFIFANSSEFTKFTKLKDSQ